ncbi:SixA phosphatase family protein [Actibacterium ureilyticum]|uniref:SixA phosphatase family protein n=1 Tax=Actibacterium ureilyticum TaxID=1590614 RepID=UPI000BAB0247|nr:histidine phosphatase family protein [Actibacterium ureilyticum]
MTLRLILTRHAKSSWDSPDMQDHDRPLNDRGRQAAPAISAWLAEHGHIPAEVVCSTARRTLETWAAMATRFPDGIILRRSPELYHATPDMMLKVLHGCASSPVMMLGHNPGIAGLASALLQFPVDHPRFGRYPTCATLVAEFDAEDWSEVDPGSGRAIDFIVPRDLG